MILLARWSEHAAFDLVEEHNGAALGTTPRIECSDDTPAFTTEESTPSGVPGCCSILTGRNFTVRKARHMQLLRASDSDQGRQDQFVVGFCSSIRQNIGPYVTFVPEPGQEYQIAPSKILYVAVGQFNPYDLNSPTLKDSPSTCKVNFGTLETDQLSRPGLAGSVSGIFGLHSKEK
ncbi:hypothetical protein ACHAPV_003555 [Trichoderma viride]